MSNILMIPASGSIIFDSQSANSSVISPLSSAPRLSYDNGGGLNITSYTTGTTTLDRFSVDGSAGRLFSISDSLTGTIFSVNDAAGLPIIQVDSDTTDIVNIGPYGTSTLVTSGTSVGIGTAAPISKLHIVDRTLAATGGLFGSILNLEQTWNTSGTPTVIKLNVTDTASNAASNLMDLQVGGASRFKIDKLGRVFLPALYTFGYAFYDIATNGGARHSFGNGGGAHYMGGVDYSNCAALGDFIGICNAFIGDVGQRNSPTLALTDVRLYRDGAGVFAQRNGINSQAFRIYNTYTSGTHFERLNLRWDTNEVKIGTEKGSSGGVARDLVFETDGTERARITADGLFSANGVSLGRGGGNSEYNTAVGSNSLISNTNGEFNTSIGLNALGNNTIGGGNVAIGSYSLYSNFNGYGNSVVGDSALQYSYGNTNCALGSQALGFMQHGSNNIALGAQAGVGAENLNNSVIIGTLSQAYNTYGDSNSIVIGCFATGVGSNSVVLGNDDITNTYLKGTVELHRENADPVNYERVAMRWNGTTGTLGTSQLGTGIARDLAFETSGTSRMTIGATGDISFSNPTQVRTALGFVQLTPSAYADLVASGLANPDTIYIVQE